MKTRLLLGMLLAIATTAFGLRPVRTDLLCHRTANQEVPENTLESLEQAALEGCDVIEIDLRQTLDGEIILNHDGFLERLTDGIGQPETTYYEDLRLLDAGSWMGDRFRGLSIARFDDALRLARRENVRLILDIKTKGIGAKVLEIVTREGMLERVQFNGEWQDVKQLDPAATDAGNNTVWVQPGVTAERIDSIHAQGKAVIANFSANSHEMDLAGMKAAVDAGVDGINVDFPRLGADAVGRPVERKLAELKLRANAGSAASRSATILALSRYSGYSLKSDFLRWLMEPVAQVSRAAALALVTAHPRASDSDFQAALRSPQSGVRANAAWALGILRAPASEVVPMLEDKDPNVLQEVLLAISRMPGEVGIDALLPLLAHPHSSVRGEAALALARHQPSVAAKVIPERLHIEEEIAAKHSKDYAQRGKPTLAQPEIDEIVGYFRCQMKMMQALTMLHGPEINRELEDQAFLPQAEFSQMNGVVSGFQLWDRVSADPQLAVQQLASSSSQIADRAEWLLVQAGPSVLTAVRSALDSANPDLRARAIQIVAWQGDIASLPRLQVLQPLSAADASLIAWAIEKIRVQHPEPEVVAGMLSLGGGRRRE